MGYIIIQACPVKARLKELNDWFDNLAYNKHKNILVGGLANFLQQNRGLGYYTPDGKGLE